MILSQPPSESDHQAAPRGDVNTVTIGEGARVDQLAVGKNIFQAKIHVGALVIPVRFLLALLVVAAVIALAAWIYFVPTQMPQGTFNLAIAEFGQRDANGNLTTSTPGKQLSEWLYNKLRIESSGLPADVQLTLWYDGMNFLQKRASIGMIRDDQEAEQIARSLNARIILYGNLAANQDVATFTPQFYVRQKEGEADELTGAQQLGKPLPLPTPLNDEYLDLYLKPRGRALVWFARGLSFDLLGRYDTAYRTFLEAEQNLQDWSRDQGKEILYYFIGREALFLGQTDQTARAAFDSAEQALTAAEKAYTTAKEIQPNYARAYLGLGQVHYQRARNLLRGHEQELDALDKVFKELQRALEWFKQGESLVELSPGSRVAEKLAGVKGASLVLMGQTYRLRYDVTRSASDLASADSFAQLAEADLETLARTLDAADARLRAQAFLTLANARFVRADAAATRGDTDASKPLYAAADQDYARCIEIAALQKFDQFLQQEVLPLCIQKRAEIANKQKELP